MVTVTGDDIIIIDNSMTETESRWAEMEYLLKLKGVCVLDAERRPPVETRDNVHDVLDTIHWNWQTKYFLYKT